MKKQRKTITKEDWLPEIRKVKDRAYLNVLKKRLEKSPPFKPYSGLSIKGKKAIKDSLEYLKALPNQPGELVGKGSCKLRTYLTVLLFMQYTPTKEEVLNGFHIFKKYFPWERNFEAAQPSGYYMMTKKVSKNEEAFKDILKVNRDGFFGLRTSYKEDKVDQQVFNFYGTPEHYGQQMGGFVEILLPANTDPKKVLKMTEELIKIAPFSHGFSGFVAAPNQANYREEIKEFYEWSRRFWALELSDLNEFWVGAKHGLITTSWLTFLNQDTVKLLKKYQGNEALNFKDKNIRITELAQGQIILSHRTPTLGDIKKTFPKAHAEVHHHLTPLLSPIRQAVRMLDEQGVTETWMNRYQDPETFALAPPDIVDQINKALHKKDEKKALEKIKKLKKFNQSGRQSIQKELSEVAFSFLSKAIVTESLKQIMQFLCDFEKPKMHDLTNLLYTHGQLNDLKIQPDHLKKIKEYAPKNPIIYNNLIDLYIQKKDLNKAADALESGVKYIDFTIYKKIKEEAFFKPLWKNEKALNAMNKIQKRVDPKSDWAPLARNKALEKKIKEHPNNRKVHLEYAKWLQKQNDPRGNLIIASIEAEEEPAKQRKKKLHAKKLLKEYINQRILSHFPKLRESIFTDQLDLIEFHWGLIRKFSLYDAHTPDALRLLESNECDFLETLFLRKTEIKDLKRIRELTGLRHLEITSNGKNVLNLSYLGSLKHLEQLNLQKSQFKSTENLGKLTTLKKLKLTQTDIKHIQFASTLKALQYIALQQTKVTDIKPLLKLPKLWEVWLNGLMLDKKQLDALEKGMQDGKRTKPGFGTPDFPIIYGTG